MATRNQSDAIRQELNGAWQQISGSFNFSYTSIAGFPRLLLHHKGSLPVLATAGSILWLKPEYQVNGGAWTDSGSGPDGLKLTFPDGKDAAIVLQCNRPGFPTAYPPGTVINTRIMARCSGSVVLCDSLIVPQEEAIKTWSQSESHQWNEAEDDVESEVFLVDHYAYDSQYSTTTASKRGSTQRFSVLIGDNVHVQFWQILGELIQFWSKVSIISVNGNVIELDEGTPQAWNDPGSLAGQDFESSVFVKGGDSQIVCKYGGGDNGELYRWTVDPVTKTLALDVNPIGLYPPVGYERPLQCWAAALEYIPQNNKILALLQEDTAPYSTHAATLLYGSAITIVGDELWDQSVWYVESSMSTQAWVGAYNGTKAVYAARLYNNSIYKVALFAVSTAGATPTKIAELDYLLDSGDMRLVGIIGDPSNDQFILLTSGTFATAPLTATLITQTGNNLIAGNSVELIPSGTEHYVAGAWIDNTVEIMAVTPGGFDVQVEVSVFVLNISGTEIENQDNWIDWERTNRLGMMSVHSASTNQFVRTSIRSTAITVLVDSMDSMSVVTDLESGVQHEAAVTFRQYRHFRIQSEVGQTQISVSVAGDPALWLIGRNTYPARENSGDEYSFDLSAPMVMAVTGGEMIWLTLVGDAVDPAATITATLS